MMREYTLNFKRMCAEIYVEIDRFSAARNGGSERYQRATAAIASAARSTLCELSAATQIRPVSIT